MLYRVAILIMLIASHLKAEDVVVFRCVGEKDGAVSVGERLSVFATGQKPLKTIYDDYLKTSWTAEPFYGPVIPYIFQDSGGQFYLVHFEFLEGHKVLGEGTRFAIGPMKTVAGSKGHYKGEPYNGSSVTDEQLLKQLRALAVQKKAPAK